MCTKMLSITALRAGNNFKTRMLFFSNTAFAISSIELDTQLGILN